MRMGSFADLIGKKQMEMECGTECGVKAVEASVGILGFGRQRFRW